MTKLLGLAGLLTAATGWTCSLSGTTPQEEWDSADLVIEGTGLQSWGLLGSGEELVEVHRIFKGVAPRFIRLTLDPCQGTFSRSRAFGFLHQAPDGSFSSWHGTYAIPPTPDARPEPLSNDWDHPERRYYESDARTWELLRAQPTFVPRGGVPLWVLLWRQPWLASLPLLIALVASGGWAFLNARRRELQLQSGSSNPIAKSAVE